MSGVMGGLRQAFEMLVRQQGGFACDATGEAAQRCNHEKNAKVCAACRVFGCIGLSRAFKLRWDVEPARVCFPESDRELHNRSHWTGDDYRTNPCPIPENKLKALKGPKSTTDSANLEYSECSIDTWIATTLSEDGKTFNSSDRRSAQTKNGQIRTAFENRTSKLRCIVLRPLFEKETRNECAEIIEKLLRHTLRFMSIYRGLGAKVNHGWGQFRLVNDEADFETEVSAFQTLKDRTGGSTVSNLPKAEDCFALEYELDSGVADLGFAWPTNANGFRAYGFASGYRLRRMTKFYHLDGGTWPSGINVADWSKTSHAHRDAPDRTGSAVARALFGRDGDDADKKHAGLIGCSHVYQKEGKSYIKFFGRIPDSPSSRYQGLTWDAAEMKRFVLDRIAEFLPSGLQPIAEYEDGSLVPKVIVP